MKELREPDLERLVPLREAAGMLGLDVSTIRKRAARTDELLLIAQGRKLFVVYRDVIAHRQKLIDEAETRRNVSQFLSPRRTGVTKTK